MKFVRISEEFELSEFELPGASYYKMHYQIQGKLYLVRVSGEFELSGFELAGLSNNNNDSFENSLEKILDIIDKENKICYTIGDF